MSFFVTLEPEAKGLMGLGDHPGKAVTEVETTPHQMLVASLLSMTEA